MNTPWECDVLIPEEACERFGGAFNYSNNLVDRVEKTINQTINADTGMMLLTSTSGMRIAYREIEWSCPNKETAERALENARIILLDDQIPTETGHLDDDGEFVQTSRDPDADYPFPARLILHSLKND